MNVVGTHLRPQDELAKYMSFSRIDILQALLRLAVHTMNISLVCSKSPRLMDNRSSGANAQS